jgi:hypothetical protein
MGQTGSPPVVAGDLAAIFPNYIAVADIDLSKIVAAWPTLPAPIRRAMIALIG